MDENAEPRRQVWHFALLVAFVWIVFASELLARRPVLYGLFNNVAPAGPAPRGVAPLFEEDWSAIVHRSDWSPPVARLLGHDRRRAARLGWVVREASVLSLPLAGWRPGDQPALVVEDSYGYRLTGLTPEQLRAVTTRGLPPFPWWRCVWGWLPLAAFAGFAAAELRWQARRRELMGVI